MTGYITTEKLDETMVFHVLRGDGTQSRATVDYETARAWAHRQDERRDGRPGSRVVMTRTMRFVCEDGG